MMNGNSALGGVLLLTGSNIIIKLLGVASQMILATLISRDDFALFALSTSIAAIVLGLRNGGSDNILVQKGRYYPSLSSKVLTYALIFNSSAFLILAVISVFASAYYSEKSLIIILLINGLGLLVGTLEPILGAKLAFDCKFKEIAIINLKSVSIKHISTILFALLGFRFYAFVLPLLIQNLYASYLSYKAHNILPKIAKISRKYFLAIFNSTKWIMAGNLCFEISNNSQLFIIGTFSDKQTLGVFFFCLILINSPVALIKGTISSVIFPKLSILIKDKNQFNAAVTRAIHIGFSMNVIAALLSGLALPFIINIFWPGKWNDAIPLLKLLVFIIPSLTLIELMNYVLASRGLWKPRFAMLAAFVIVEVATVTISVMHFDIIYTCITLVAIKAVFSICAVWYIFNLCQLSLDKYVRFIFIYFLPTLPAMILAIVNELSIAPGDTSYLYLFTVSLTLIYYLYLSREIIIQLCEKLLRRKNNLAQE